MKNICFWSVGDNDFAYMLQNLVDTFRGVGMEEDFIAFSDRQIEGAITEIVPPFKKDLCFFKFDFLKKLAKTDYQYFVFLDADTVFVRKPRVLLSFMQDTPLHAFLEFDLTYVTRRKTWWGNPLEVYVELMRECGITSEKIYNVNGGFFIIKREAIDIFCGLADDFWQHAVWKGYKLNDEPLIAYAMQMLCQDPTKHLLENNLDIWASDWLGQFHDRLPDGKKWVFGDYFHDRKFEVNPAIVHALKSKNALIEAGKKRF